MPQQSYCSAPTAIQSHLLRRQMIQVRSRSQEERQALVHLAGRTFLPTTGSLTFDSPIQRLGDVVLVVLSRAITTNHDGGPRETLFLRGYTARINARLAVTRWGIDTSCFAYDLTRQLRPAAWGPVLPLENTALIRVGLDLDRECERQSHRSSWLPCHPILPPTLLALPPDAPLDPQPTPTVLAHAKQYGVAWDDAWHDLWRRWRVPDEINDTGCELVDTRLRSSMQASPGWAASLAEFHDMRDFINRAIYNPIRDVALPPEANAQEVSASMRRRLPPDLAEACRDSDLVAAAKNPRAPLVVTGLAKLHVWQLPQGATVPESFNLSCTGHEGNLWQVKPHWRDAILGVPRCQASAVSTVGTELAECDRPC